MINLEDINIYLLDINPMMTNEWNRVFKDYNNIIVIHNDLNTFLKNTPVDCVVSPANSYGLMDGGYDKAITVWYGRKLMRKVQKYIIDNFMGEQTVGTAFITETDSLPKYLIHSPAMRTPEIINDLRVIYDCMRSTLVEAMKNDIKTIVIPAWGGACGRVKPKFIAEYMWIAYNDLLINKVNEITWGYALRYK